jgi:hypothetical protein
MVLGWTVNLELHLLHCEFILHPSSSFILIPRSTPDSCCLPHVDQGKVLGLLVFFGFYYQLSCYEVCSCRYASFLQV